MTREVFESLTHKEQEFLIGTGFLSYFDAKLCSELFKEFTKTSFQEMMEGLLRKNLFVLCIDEQNGVYRYHNILAEYLTKQLGFLPGEEQVEYHLCAARAFEKRGDLTEALREFYAIKDFENMMRLINTIKAQIETLGYLNKIPLEFLFTDPDLAAQSFIYTLGNLDEERCLAIYEKFEAMYSNNDIFRALEFAQAYVSHDLTRLSTQTALKAEQIDALPFGAMVKSFLPIGNSVLLLGQMDYAEAENCINKAIEANQGENVLVEFYAQDQLLKFLKKWGA